jgi:hypothetical protein
MKHHTKYRPKRDEQRSGELDGEVLGATNAALLGGYPRWPLRLFPVKARGHWLRDIVIRLADDLLQRCPAWTHSENAKVILISNFR